MAIMRLDPKAVFKIISSTDDALLSETAEELKETNAEGIVTVKQPRYTSYIDGDFDESKLLFKDGQKPDRIMMRVLTSDEYTDIYSKYTIYNPTSKQMLYKDQQKMYLRMFQLTFEGIELADGSVIKPSVEELGVNLQIEMGAIQNIITALGKNRKK